METIIVKPNNTRQYKEVVDFLKKMRVKTEIYKEQSKKEILNSIEKGAKEVALHLKGKKKLKAAKDLLREL
jgi:hypothetical protein